MTEIEEKISCVEKAVKRNVVHKCTSTHPKMHRLKWSARQNHEEKIKCRQLIP
jgi:hypothetical protein